MSVSLTPNFNPIQTPSSSSTASATSPVVTETGPDTTGSTPETLQTGDDENQVNPKLQGVPDNPDASQVAARPSQLEFVDQPLEQKTASLEDVRSGQGTLQEGQSGEAVGKFQGLFMKLGLLLAGAPSDAFSPLLKMAVKSFQEENGLPATGKVDQRTMQAVDTRVRSLDAETPPAQETPVVPVTPVQPQADTHPEEEQTEEADVA